MPYLKQKNDKGQICVYKKGDDGNATGDALGCHDSESGADAQIAALYASEQNQEKKSPVTFLRSILSRILGTHLAADIKQEVEQEIDRALSFSRLYNQVGLALEPLQPMPDEEGILQGDYISPIDLYVENGATYLICSQGGKLYRADVTIANDKVTLGQMQEVTEAFPSVQQASLSVIRAQDGTRRWLCVAATSVLNRDNAIDSRQLFDSFISRIERTKEYPQLDFWHLGSRLVIGRADYVARDENCYLGTGTFNADELSQAAADTLERDDKGYWGTSISFKPTVEPTFAEITQGVKIPVYTEGINNYISILPEARAASLFTTIGAQEVNRMKQEKYEALVKLVGEERAKQFAEKVDATNREIAEQGLITRQADANKDSQKPDKSSEDKTPVTRQGTEDKTQQPDKTSEQTPTVEMSDEVLAEIVKRAITSDDIKALSDAMTAMRTQMESITAKLAEDAKKDEDKEQAMTLLVTRLEKLEKTDDEKREQWRQDMPNQTRIVVTRPRVHRAQEVNPAKPQEVDLSNAAKATLENARTRQK